MRVAEILLGVVLPVLIGSGIALALSDAIFPRYWIARNCFIVAAMDILALAVCRLWAGDAKVSSKLMIGAGVGAMVIPVVVVALRWVDFREGQNSTKLLAGDMPTPALPPQGRVPQDALILFLGSNIAWTKRMPHTVVEMGSDKMLVIDKDNSGNKLVVIVLNIFDETNNIIGRFDERGLSMASSTRIKKPDRSTLAVFDHGDIEVMRITFLNPKALSIMGVFRYAGLRTVAITSEYLDVGRMRITQASLGENERADISVCLNQRNKEFRESHD